MVKKLLLITFICFSTVVFSQKTLQKLTAAPNPFYNTTKISYTATSKQAVFLVVKNVLGKTVYKKAYKANVGKNTIIFKKNNLQAGMYIYAIRSRKEIISKRFVIK